MTSMGTKPLGRPTVHDGSVDPAAQCYLTESTSPADAALYYMQVLEAIVETQGACEELARLAWRDPAPGVRESMHAQDLRGINVRAQGASQARGTQAARYDGMKRSFGQLPTGSGHVLGENELGNCR